jgi:hypothetical protein
MTTPATTLPSSTPPARLGLGIANRIRAVSNPPSPNAERKPRPDAAETLAAGVASPENAPAGLDWQAFSAAYFQGRHRHDLEAVTAYSAYRRADMVEQRTPEGGDRAEQTGDTTLSRALRTWEDEGGAVS